ncbi:phosphatidic acid phosphatase type 2/haloperoxidase [Dipodascopsis tothii]|uniref:phosphatidic acid phosphatase type 2/haloperoxidase n=1 Tax=Dipodascopsis tothii TaxID=44089 RepID=UPI0034CE7913
MSTYAAVTKKMDLWAPVLHRYHLVDWIYVWLLFGGFLVLEEMNPFFSMFSLDDVSIQHPYATSERVTSINGVIINVTVPVGVMVLMTPLLHRKGDWKHVLNVSLLSLAHSIFLTEFVTDLLKNTIGRTRPDFIARCMPAPGTPLTGLVGIEVCTNPNMGVLYDGFRSTPSGHSSLSFAGLGFLSAWLAGQLHIFQPGAELFKTMFSLIPLVMGLFIGISRIEDYRHHITDIIFGGVIGTLVAWYSYRKFFPHLGRSDSDAPLAIKDVTDAKPYAYGEFHDSLDSLEAQKYQ